MLIWRGWGISVFFLFLIWLGVAAGVLSGMPYFRAMNTDMAIQWGLGFACILDAASTFLLARYRQSHPKKITDPETGTITLVARVDDFFYLRLEWWTYLLLGIAAVLIGTALAGIQLISG